MFCEKRPYDVDLEREGEKERERYDYESRLYTLLVVYRSVVDEMMSTTRFHLYIYYYATTTDIECNV